MTGKPVVLITAGASGIGRAISEKFLKAGAQVHIVDVDPDLVHQFSAKHPGTLTSVADVADEKAVGQVVTRHEKAFGRVDVLVNCAGIAGPTALVEDISLSDWRRCLAVNLDATFLFAKKIVPLMKTQASGVIINISSTAGWHGYPRRAPYSSSKWAVIGFTKSLSMELGIHGIRANVICPGSVDGERMDRVIQAESREKKVSEETVRSSYTKSNSLRTFIDADDIADMAVFLASDNAARVTGQVMNVDGHLESFGSL